MRRHIEVDQSTAVMLDDNEHVQDSEYARHRDMEITSNDGSCVIAQEGRPSLISAWPSWRRSRHILGHRARRHLQAEFQQQFVRDALLTRHRRTSAPRRHLQTHHRSRLGRATASVQTLPQTHRTRQAAQRGPSGSRPRAFWLHLGHRTDEHPDAECAWPLRAQRSNPVLWSS